MNLASALLTWYKQNKRDLPWRETRDPYHIWLSEIIMQQTRVEQGTPYYLSFIENFPTVKDLATAPSEKVMKLWQGLGYYSRARNLHEAAKYIHEELGGKFPEEYTDILSLKGVGEYTASAIASFAYNKPHAVVDGNVYRFLSRVFGISTPIDSPKGKKEFKALADELLDKKDPGTYNQAIMEFGGRYCKPNNPDCPNCIFQSICVAKEKKLVDKLPVKANKTKVRDRHFQYLVIRYKSRTWIKQRGAKDIWEGLFDFPMIESDKALTESQLKKSPFWKKHLGKAGASILKEPVVYKHILSHQRIYASFWEVEVESKVNDAEWTETAQSKLHEYAVPRLVDRYLEESA
jgi:A/G-specific adenine glycosylase